MDSFHCVPRGWRHGRRTDRPRISGTIIEEDGRTVLKGEMKFNAFLKWFLIIMPLFFVSLSFFQIDMAVVMVVGSVVIVAINLIYFHTRFNASADKCIEQLNIIAGHTIDVDDDKFDAIY